MRFILIAIFFLSVLVPFAGIAHAQSFATLEPLTIDFSPKYPQPGQKVTATVTSSETNARTATIAWLLDGTVKKQEAGGITFTFTASGAGTTQTIEVLVRTADGQISSKTISIRPSQVTLLWEADTYTPPFYKGRALFSIGASVRAEAVTQIAKPSGGFYPSSEITYTWSKDGVVLGSLSGLGAATLITDGPKFFGTYILSVEARSPDGVQAARSSALIKTHGPLVRIYARDPLTGVQYQTNISNDYSFTSTSLIELQAIPYFMNSVTTNDPAIRYTWEVNGGLVSTAPETPSILNIQLSSDENITTQVHIGVDSVYSIPQTAELSLKINFEGSTRNSIFGL